jgi:SNF2 family DNA or RNA helicase
MKILDKETLDEMDRRGEEYRQQFVILDSHPDFENQWIMDAFDESFLYEANSIIGRYRAVNPANLTKFLDLCKEMGKICLWVEDPTMVIDSYESLKQIPEVKIESPFDNTINGFLPFQAQGFNFLKNLRGGVVEWSTGTGKTVIASALLKYHDQLDNFDLALFVVKSHNTINTKRSVKRLVGIDSTVIRGPKKRREKLYEAAREQGSVIVLNYEKFRVDQEILENLIGGKRVLIIWDEMPTKLKNRSSQIYQNVIRCLYDTHPPQVKWAKRKAELRQYMLSATPIENNPEDFFNCVRIIDPDVYGTIKEFRNEYVRAFDFFDRNKPSEWHNLDKMGLKASHIVHQVDKQDKDIAKMFPDVISEPYFVDWNDKQRKLYELLTKEIGKLDIDEVSPLALITILQMLCDMPEMILNSAATYEAFENAFEEFAQFGGDMPKKSGSEMAYKIVQAIGKDKITNDGHTKLDVLRSLITEVHPNEKITVFSAFNEGLMPYLRKYLEEWDVNYVYYGGTAKQRQDAEDKFKNDPDLRVFLSSDAGSDSINLEVGSVCIHYDLPWKWSTYIQRENRIHRVTSEFDTVRFYTLLMANSVEDRKLQVVIEKMGFHDAVFKGAIADQAISQRMTREDLEFILKG